MVTQKYILRSEKTYTNKESKTKAMVRYRDIYPWLGRDIYPNTQSICHTISWSTHMAKGHQKEGRTRFFFYLRLTESPMDPFLELSQLTREMALRESFFTINSYKNLPKYERRAFKMARISASLESFSPIHLKSKNKTSPFQLRGIQCLKVYNWKIYIQRLPY